MKERFYVELFVSDGDLYTGTVADFSGMDPIIYREPLQTEQYDSMSLNGEFSKGWCVFVFDCFWLIRWILAPDFVSSMTQRDFVYFFFRETAVEYINCGKVNISFLFLRYLYKEFPF